MPLCARRHSTRSRDLRPMRCQAAIASRWPRLPVTRLTASGVGVLAEQAQQPERIPIDRFGVHDKVPTTGMFPSPVQNFVNATSIVQALLIAVPHHMGSRPRLLPEVDTVDRPVDLPVDVSRINRLAAHHLTIPQRPRHRPLLPPAAPHPISLARWCIDRLRTAERSRARCASLLDRLPSRCRQDRLARVTGSIAATHRGADGGDANP